MSDEYLHLVQNATTANEAWQRITEHFDNRGSGEIYQLRLKLTTARLAECKRGSELTCLESHLTQLRRWATQLAAQGENVPEGDFIQFVFASLPESYQQIVSVLATQPTADLTEDYRI